MPATDLLEVGYILFMIFTEKESDKPARFFFFFLKVQAIHLDMQLPDKFNKIKILFWSGQQKMSPVIKK